MKPNVDVDGRRVTQLETQVPESDALREAVELAVLRHAAGLATEVVEIRALNAELVAAVAPIRDINLRDMQREHLEQLTERIRAAIAKAEAARD
jgi:hypothetical protein